MLTNLDLTRDISNLIKHEQRLAQAQAVIKKPIKTLRPLICWTSCYDKMLINQIEKFRPQLEKIYNFSLI